MQEPIVDLMSGIRAAIGANLIPYAVTAGLPKIQQALIDQIAIYQKSNPPPRSPSTLTQKLDIAGLQGSQVSAFVELFSNSAAAPQSFWATLAKNPGFQAQQVSMLQAVFTLSQLTGEQMVLTDQLVKATRSRHRRTCPSLQPIPRRTG